MGNRRLSAMARSVQFGNKVKMYSIFSYIRQGQGDFCA